MQNGEAIDAFRREVVEHLATLRQQKGMSQTAFARELGTEQSIISKVESGNRELGLHESFAWGETLGLSPAETANILAAAWTKHCARRKGFWEL